MLNAKRVVRPIAVLAAIGAWGAASPATAQDADRPKEVLVLNSTRQNEQFYIVSEREIPKLLTAGLEHGVNFYTEYLDANRFSQPQYGRVYVDFLRRKYAGRHLDLLLLMATPAMEFMVSHRDELFTGTPAVFYSISPPHSAIANSTGLLNPFRFAPSIDLALALQPDLERVYVVSGATAADRAFENQARVEFRRFDGRIAFTYFSGLVTSDLEARLRALPPHSAVFYTVVTQDGTGKIFQQMPYLARIAAVANAPTYSWADTSVEDAGIVGGRRRDQVNQMKGIAALALRVLRGEPVNKIPISSLDADIDQVDWRQLQRWRLPASRLPAGTRVVFRPPGMWEQYERYIVTAMMLMLAQAVLIAGLLVQREKRRRVELELRGRERDLRTSQADLRLSYDRIRRLTRRLIGEQEAERARVASELHDDINQQLALLSIDLDRLRRDPLPLRSAKRFSRALETARGISISVRKLSHRLHPSRLRLLGLVGAIDTLRRDLSPAHLAISFRHESVPPHIDQRIALCLFRVTQEALQNALKHSDAEHITVELKGDLRSVALTITDDGKGFDVDRLSSPGIGLISMRERVESFGGVLAIEATPASGTCLRVMVPVHAVAAVASA